MLAPAVCRADDMANGERRLSWPDGQLRYDGGWRDGQRDGTGREFDSRGQMIYSGEWRAGVREGQGKTFEDGAVTYKGAFQADACHGKGTAFVGGTQLYCGDWRAGLYHGAGVLTDQAMRGRPVYCGSFAAGTRHGKGRCEMDVVRLDGQRARMLMEGDWANNCFSGSGSVSINGAVKCSGSWRDGKAHGQASQFHPNGTVEYAGAFVDGERNGFGTWSMLQRSEDTHVSLITYVGEWRDNERHGAGTLWCLTHMEYQGGWRAGKFHGIGVLYYADGSERYRGSFCAGRRSGYGTYQLVERGCDATYDGEWADDQPHGAGTLVILHGQKRAWRAWHNLPADMEHQLNVAIRTVQDVADPHPIIASARAFNETLRDAHAEYVRNGGGSDCVSAFRELQQDSQFCRGLGASVDDVLQVTEDLSAGEWRYEGYWQRGLRQGKGVLSCSGQPVYVGDWRGDDFHGQGSLTKCTDTITSGWRGGAAHEIDLYEGEFRDSLRHGEGVAHVCNGAIYRGTWAADQPHGSGTLLCGLVAGSADDCPQGGLLVYAGCFAHGLPAGRGTLSFDGQVWYTGDFDKSRFHGRGKLRMDAAALLAAGIRHARICEYVGGFRDGQRSGQGVLTDSRGLVLHDGRWQHGVFVPPAAPPQPSSAAVAAAAADASALKLLASAQLEARRQARSEHRKSAPVRWRAAAPAVEPPARDASAAAQPPASSRCAAVLLAVAASEVTRVASPLPPSEPACALREAVPMLRPAPDSAAQQTARSAESATVARRRAANEARRAKRPAARRSLDQFNKD